MKLLTVFFLLFSIMEKCSLAHGDEKVNLLRRSVECPSGWTAINDRCFSYFATEKTFASAEKHCLTLDAHLASVHSQNDYEQIQKLVLKATGLKTAAWIGGSNTPQAKAFKWTDGTPMTYTNWCIDQPNGIAKPFCIQINTTFDKCWDDVACPLRVPFLCVKKNTPPKVSAA